jgi:Arc/MetJ-type ribon-helix-helix transcriptional regulator
MIKHYREQGNMKREEKEMVRKPISITLPKECVDWLDKKVESRIYASRSHAVELLVLDAMRHERTE